MRWNKTPKFPRNRRATLPRNFPVRKIAKRARKHGKAERSRRLNEFALSLFLSNASKLPRIRATNTSRGGILNLADICCCFPRPSRDTSLYSLPFGRSSIDVVCLSRGKLVSWSWSFAWFPVERILLVGGIGRRDGERDLSDEARRGDLSHPSRIARDRTEKAASGLFDARPRCLGRSIDLGYHSALIKRRSLLIQCSRARARAHGEINNKRVTRYQTCNCSR